MNSPVSLASHLLKELRLLRPAWALAMICAVLPIFGINPDRQMFFLTFGLILLGVRAFGSEFSQGTFLLYLSQPVGRNRLWAMKAVALLVAMSSVVTACLLFLKSLHLDSQHTFFEGETVWLWIIALAATGSGLFFSVLFRHATTALWMAIIVPLVAGLFALLVSSWWAPEVSQEIVEILLKPGLVCYGILGGLGSWLLFRSAQDVDRFNSVVNTSLPLGGWVTAGIRRIRLANSPGSALVAKELGLQQVNLGLVVLLVVLHFTAVAASHWKTPSMNSYAGVAIVVSWFLLMTLPPLLIGCVAVAEERHLGTLLWHRTLPISAKKQWLIKLAVVYGLTFFTAWILPFFLRIELAEVAPPTRLAMTVTAFAVATLGLFVSSLSVSLLSAFGTAFGLGIAAVCGFQFLDGFSNLLLQKGWLSQFFHNYWSIGFIHLWLLLGGVSISIATLWLIFRNMQRVTLNKRDVIFNGCVLCGTIFLGVAMSWMIFYRVWENLVPYPEPQPIVRLHGNVRPKIEGWFESKSVLLPDGRLISTHLSEPSSSGFTVITTGGHNSDETRWQDVAVSNPSTYGIREDGTLWCWGNIWSHPENQRLLKDVKKPSPQFFQAPSQIGTSTDWKNVFAGPGTVFAVKKDHSLWAWGHNESRQLGTGTTSSETAPIRVGSDNDWIQVSPHDTHCLGLKSDGSLWLWGTDHTVSPALRNDIPVPLNLGSDWAEVRLMWALTIGLKKDHSLWLITRDTHTLGEHTQFVSFQLGHESNWKRLGHLSYGQPMAIKSDGSLWRILLPTSFTTDQNLRSKLREPERVGHSTNWLAASEFAALAGDGSFIGMDYARFYSAPPQDRRFFLVPSRLCPFVLNLAQGNKP